MVKWYVYMYYYSTTLLFLITLCFNRSYITSLRCSDVKPLSFTHCICTYRPYRLINFSTVGRLEHFLTQILKYEIVIR